LLKVRSFKDPSGNPVHYSKSSVTSLTLKTQAFRTMTTEGLRDETFASTGNELQNYDAATWCRGVCDRLAKLQLCDTPGLQDPGCYNAPAFLNQVWYSLLKPHPGLALKIACFAFEITRNWGQDSIRPAYFLTVQRMQSTAPLVRADWIQSMYGMADCYGAFMGPAYQWAFQEMANMAARDQVGQDYPFDYLEGTFFDLLYFYAAAARNPEVDVILPGQQFAVTPSDMGPDEWAQALITGFETLIVRYRSVSLYTNWVFYRSKQGPYPALLQAAPQGATEGTQGGTEEGGKGGGERQRAVWHKRDVPLQSQTAHRRTKEVPDPLPARARSEDEGGATTLPGLSTREQVLQTPHRRGRAQETHRRDRGGQAV
jgi:hypothetical protein